MLAEKEMKELWWKFEKFYLKRYWTEYEDIYSAIERGITVWIKADNDEEYNAWREFFSKALKDPNRKYKWNRTVLDKILWDFYLSCSPKCLKE